MNITVEQSYTFKVTVFPSKICHSGDIVTLTFTGPMPDFLGDGQDHIAQGQQWFEKYIPPIHSFLCAGMNGCVLIESFCDGEMFTTIHLTEVEVNSISAKGSTAP